MVYYRGKLKNNMTGYIVFKIIALIGMVETNNKAITETNFNGLIIRLIYKSNGASDVYVGVNMKAYS